MSNYYGLDLYSDRGSGGGGGEVGRGKSSGGAEFSPTQPTVYAQQRGSLIKQSRGYSVKLESGCGDSLAPPGAKVPPVGVTAVGHLRRFYQCHLLLCRTVVPLHLRARFTVPGRVQTYAGTPVQLLSVVTTPLLADEWGRSLARHLDQALRVAAHRPRNFLLMVAMHYYYYYILTGASPLQHKDKVPAEGAAH